MARFGCPEARSEAFLWDAAAPVLGTRATANGARAYVFQSEFMGRTLRMTIGGLDAWSIANAQEKARELRRQIDGGRDPREVKAETAARAEEEGARSDEARSPCEFDAPAPRVNRPRRNSRMVCIRGDDCAHSGGSCCCDALRVPRVVCDQEGPSRVGEQERCSRQSEEAALVERRFAATNVTERGRSAVVSSIATWLMLQVRCPAPIRRHGEGTTSRRRRDAPERLACESDCGSRAQSTLGRDRKGLAMARLSRARPPTAAARVVLLRSRASDPAATQ